MSPDAGETPLERPLATLLSLGTWLGSAVIGLGLLAPLGARPRAAVVMAGLAVFILLPVLRVALMLRAYLRARDWPLFAAASLVLLLIGLNVLAGLAARR